MGREIAIICIILIAIFSVNFIVINLLKDSTQELQGMIDDVNSKIDNMEEAKGAIQNLNDRWEEINKKWSIVVSHQELDQIDLSLISAKKAIENDNVNDAVIELGKLEFLLKHINEKESFLLKNIF